MPPPLPRVCLPLTIPASWVYRSAIALRNRRYDRNGVERISVPVISVGNITTGGVGKTPMVAWLARQLLEAGHRPAICMRGYGSSRTQRSDEEMEYEAILPEVAVIADPKRAAAARRHLSRHPETDCLLLDDGFQHRQLHRDLDLVLLDATVHLPAERMLPAGHLREPVGNLQRADAVIITHASGVDEQLAAFVRQHHGQEPIAWTQHAWRSLRVIDEDGERNESVQWLIGKRLVTMLGIGNPQAMRDQLVRSGGAIAADIPVRDHVRYDEEVLAHARRAAVGLDGVVVTGKDWVKLRSVLNLRTWPVPIVVPELTIELLQGEQALQQLIFSSMQRSAAAETPTETLARET